MARTDLYDPKSTATSSSWVREIRGYSPPDYATVANPHAWIRASFIRFLNAQAGVKEGEPSVLLG